MTSAWALSVVCRGVLALCPAAGDSAAVDRGVADRFVAHVQESDAFPETARRFVASQWAQRADDDEPDTFLLEALAVLSPEFRAGLEAFDEDRYADCSSSMAGLTGKRDPYLAANASVYEIKALVAADALEEAEARITDLLDRTGLLAEFTCSEAEIAYLKGYCELGNLQYADSATTLRGFLERFPQAPQRLRLTAQQMLTELARRVPGGIGAVTDLLDYAGRRLANADSGQRVQQRQQEAIDILDKLIDEAEEQEKNSGSGSGSGSPRNRPRQPQSPLNDSRPTPGGPTETGGMRQRVATPGEAWGAMQDAQRERIVQTLKDRFPDRYRQLVEQYYRQLAEEP